LFSRDAVGPVATGIDVGLQAVCVGFPMQTGGHVGQNGSRILKKTPVFPLI
jgi:hypothetical protein